MSDPKRQMVHVMNLDDGWIKCVCGSILHVPCSRDNAYEEWMKEHKPHCDEMLNVTSDDGNRIFDKPQDPYVTEL